MPWFKVDDGLPFHRKVVAAGNAAMGLWVRAGAWSAHELTDGFIPDHMLAIMGTAPQAAKLIKVGLWVRVDGGVQFHQWSENGRQPTSESVRKERADAAKRQAEWRAKQAAEAAAAAQVAEARNGVTGPLVTDAVTGAVTGAPTRPDPTVKKDRATRRADPVSDLAQTITKEFSERRKLTNFPAVRSIVLKALKADYEPDAVRAALSRHIVSGRTVTTDSLRIELDGNVRPIRVMPHGYDEDGVMRDPKTGVAIER